MIIEVPREIKELSNIFKKNGKGLFIVGGWIRDTLMGLHPIDIDLATDALPDESISFLKGKYKLDYVGKSFGVIIVHTGNMKIEIATFRKDLTIGRHPEVKLGASIEDDSKRRDIAISAIYYDLEQNKIVDLVGGISDIKNKIIRMVGDPKDRIEEDQLRALRVIRFACRYNFDIDNKTFNDLKKYTDLSNISPERIFEEIYKSFKQCDDFTAYLEYLNDLGLWNQVFPGSKINTNITQCHFFEVYMSNLFKMEPFNTLQRKLVHDYKFPDTIARIIFFLVWFQYFKPEMIIEYLNKKDSYKINPNIILEWCKIANLNDVKFKKFINYKKISSAEDLMSKGFSGKSLGDEIKRIEIKRFSDII